MMQHFVSLFIVEYVRIQKYSKVNNKLTTDVSLFFFEPVSFNASVNMTY